MCPPK